MRGGIPDRDLDALGGYWDVLPSVRALLFESVGRRGYSRLKLPVSEVKAAIFGHPEFTAFNGSVTAVFQKWRTRNERRLRAIKPGDHPKALIETLSEDLLETFRSARLLDAYDVYQHLMDYWADAMQDDVYLLVQEGWKAVLDGKPNTDLIPQPLIIARYFAADQAAIERLEADRDAVTRRIEELDEEHGGEDGLLAEAKTDKGNVTAKSVKDRVKAIKDDNDADDERKMLGCYLALIERESEAGKKVKDSQKALDAKVAAKYSKLTEAEIKVLVVDDKWLATLGVTVQSELDRVSQGLTGRIRELAERYATTLTQLSDEVATLAARVHEHLNKMGAG